MHFHDAFSRLEQNMIMMKKLFTCLLLLSLGFTSNAQTTITATYITPTVTFSTGLTFVTFAIRNNNSFPVVLTNMTGLQANLYDNNNYALWYSASSVGGAPTVSGPAWIQVTSSIQPFTVSVIGQVTPFNCIGLVIPPSTTYRFALQGTKGTAVRGAVTPNIFSSGGVDLLVGDNISTGGQVGYFGWQNIGVSGTPYFFDGSITVSAVTAFTDIQVLNITKPTSVCSATGSTLMAQVCNKSPNVVNFAVNNTNVNFVVNGPISTTATVPLVSGTLAPCGCLNATLGGVNFSSPGTYTITATANISGVVDANPSNNTAIDSLINYKPVITPPIDSVCQFTSGPLFPGFNGSNCVSRDRTAIVSTLLTSVPPIDGSSDATANLFAQGGLPGLPAGAVITGAKLLITNLNCQATGSFGNQARFSIYSPLSGAGAPFVPGVPGSPLNFSVYNFDYGVDITAAQMNAMYASIGAGGNFSIGYWESLDNLPGASDIQLNAQTLPTQARITISYTITPQLRWYTSPAGGSSFYTGSTLNPFVTPSGLFNTNTTGNFTFYAACSSDSVCRLPVTLKINPSPLVVQDSLETCEIISSTGNGSFDLTTLSNSVSAFNPLATVSFYQDQNLSLFISNPTTYISNTDVVYSKIQVGSCHSSDSVYLLVHEKPEFVSALVSGAVCQPDYIDAALLIDPFSTVTPGTDTLFFEDPMYLNPHPNPHMVSTNDTVYMLFVTNTTPACMDSSEAIINVFPLNNYIVNQDTNFNFSIPGVVNCASFNLGDGMHDTLHSQSDCSRIVSIEDTPNGISLGNTMVCEEIDPGVMFHNNQPYVNRHYQITPTTNDSAMVCLYFLDDDLVQYNNAAFGTWPLLPTAANPSLVTNLCISETHNGDINTPGHTVTVIPNTAITATYDSLTTVWTMCFHVDSFSYFYAHSQNPLNIALPAEVISFTGKKVSNGTLLEWITANETNNHYFILERSRDGKEFYEFSGRINTKALNGNSNTDLYYNFNDEHPFSGYTYYRLQQVDIDGKKHESQTIRIYTENEKTVTLFPNPVNEILNVTLKTLQGNSSLIKILDVTGRVVRTVAFESVAGNNAIQIDMSPLANGLYLITVSDDQGFYYTETIRKK